MKLHLAGTCSREEITRKYKPPFVLESYYYIQQWQVEEMKYYKSFILDSGAFTFMSSRSNGVDFEAYAQKYAQFVLENNIEKYLELDIDSVVGYDKVKKLRARIEEITGRRSIPVWHKSRGLKEWEKMVDECDYVAIGGLVTKEIKPSEYCYLPQLLQIAKKNNCKVHGLGFENKESFKMGFESCDSTNWLSSSRFGGVQYFNGSGLSKKSAPKGQKSVHYKIRDEFVMQEYIKLQRYLDR